MKPPKISRDKIGEDKIELEKNKTAYLHNCDRCDEYRYI